MGTPLPDAVWPWRVLMPETVNVDKAAQNVVGPAPPNGAPQVIASSAGYAKLTLTNIRVRDRAARMAFRSIADLVDGGAGSILVPAFGRKDAPWATGAISETVPGSTPFASGARFASGAGFYKRSIIANANSAWARGAMQVDILLSAGSALKAGHMFSVGQRLCRITRVLRVSGSVYTVRLWLPLREAVPANATLDFDNPVCRCKLEKPDGMELALEHLVGSKPTVSFVEDTEVYA